MNLLITGASRGIGREIVEQYLKNPSLKKIWLTTTNPERLSGLMMAHPEKIKIISTSVSQPGSEAIIKDQLKNETIDLLINNAGTYLEEPDDFESLNVETVMKTFQVNTLSAIRVCQAVLPSLERAAHPKVIQITSLMGSITDNTSGGSYGYRISKAALNMFNKSFSIDYPQIASFVVHPGWVKS